MNAKGVFFLSLFWAIALVLFSLVKQEKGSDKNREVASEKPQNSHAAPIKRGEAHTTQTEAPQRTEDKTLSSKGVPRGPGSLEWKNVWEDNHSIVFASYLDGIRYGDYEVRYEKTADGQLKILEGRSPSSTPTTEKFPHVDEREFEEALLNQEESLESAKFHERIWEIDPFEGIIPTVILEVVQKNEVPSQQYWYVDVETMRALKKVPRKRQ